MSYSRTLHKSIDDDILAQIEAHGKVQRQAKGVAKSFRHKVKRLATKPEVKLRPFTGKIRKNQKRTEFFL